jgi:hypothetical protein
MWFVHLYRIVKVALELIFPASFRAQVLIGTIIEIFSILIYIGGTFYNQNMYFYYNEETNDSLKCDKNKLGISEYWILFEIVVFYMQIGVSMFSILNAQIFLPENLKDILVNKRPDVEQEDYMVAFAGYAQVLNLFFSQVVIPYFGMYAEDDYEKDIPRTTD